MENKPGARALSVHTYSKNRRLSMCVLRLCLGVALQGALRGIKLG